MDSLIKKIRGFINNRVQNSDMQKTEDTERQHKKENTVHDLIFL